MSADRRKQEPTEAWSVWKLRARKPIVLAFGFAALLIVLASSTVLVWRSATHAQRRIATLHETHLETAALLGRVRSDVYMIAITTRDYLLSATSAQAARYRNQVLSLHDQTKHDLDALAALGQAAGESATISELQHEFDGYWDLTAVVFQWDPAQNTPERAEVLKQRVRRREEMFQLTTRVENLLNDNFRRERERIAGLDFDFRSSIIWISALALIAGLGISTATVVRMMTLERRSKAAESELRRLSGQIRTAQEQERKFLSRELHDQVGQLLTGLRMELTSVSRLNRGTNKDIEPAIHRAKGTVEQTLRVVRNIAMLLRPSMLDDLGLTPALHWLVKEMARSGNIEIQADIEAGLDALPDAHRTCLYRVVQEALTNAIRHAGASRIDLKVWSGDGYVNGIIADDGRGFDRAMIERKGLGLVGMEERARELGGNLRVDSAPGRGTRVEIRLSRSFLAEVESDQRADRGRPRDRADRFEATPRPPA